MSKADPEGNTELHLAALRKDFDLVKSLVENGADVNAPNNSNIRPIHIAAGRESFEITQYLINHGAILGILDNQGLCILHYAVVLNEFSPAMLEFLLKYNFDYEIKQEILETPTTAEKAYIVWNALSLKYGYDTTMQINAMPRQHLAPIQEGDEGAADIDISMVNMDELIESNFQQFEARDKADKEELAISEVIDRATNLIAKAIKIDARGSDTISYRKLSEGQISVDSDTSTLSCTSAVSVHSHYFPITPERSMDYIGASMLVDDDEF